MKDRPHSTITDMEVDTSPDPASSAAAMAEDLAFLPSGPAAASAPPGPVQPTAEQQAASLAQFRLVLCRILLVVVPSLLLLAVAHFSAAELPFSLGRLGRPGSSSPASAGSAAPPLTPVQAALPPLRPDTIGALLVAFQNPRAVLEVLREYRAAYPEGDLVVLCDNGCFNYTATCAHFHCEWEEAPLRLTTKTDPGWYMRPPNSMVYLQALARFLPRIRSKYYMYLETDVSIKARVPLDSLHYSLNGIVDPHRGWMVGAEPFFAANLNPGTFDLAAFPRSPRPDMLPGAWLPYGGQGGAILNTQLMRAVALQPKAQRAADMRVLGGCSTTTGVDYWHSAVVYRYNGTVGPYASYAIAGARALPDLQADPAILVIHPDKSHYGSQLTEEDQAILGPHWGSELSQPPEQQPEETLEPWDCCCPLKDFEYRAGSSGLQRDEEGRGAAFDIEDIRGVGYFAVQS